MTKAAAIRQTHVARPWLTPEQIGELMGCAAGYVRLVLGMSNAH